MIVSLPKEIHGSRWLVASTDGNGRPFSCDSICVVYLMEAVKQQ